MHAKGTSQLLERLANIGFYPTSSHIFKISWPVSSLLLLYSLSGFLGALGYVDEMKVREMTLREVLTTALSFHAPEFHIPICLCHFIDKDTSSTSHINQKKSAILKNRL